MSSLHTDKQTIWCELGFHSWIRPLHIFKKNIRETIKKNETINVHLWSGKHGMILSLLKSKVSLFISCSIHSNMIMEDRCPHCYLCRC